MDFKEEIIKINKTNIPTYLDSDGLRWFPMNYFLSKVLISSYKSKHFTDTIIEKYMQIIDYNSPYQNNSLKLKTWFINENGIKLILKNIRINQYSRYTIKKEKALFECCLFFGVKRKDTEKMYTMISPDLKNYSKWELSCFKYDDDSRYHIWKMCIKCGRHFPETSAYFAYENRIKEKLSHECLLCKGFEFKNRNKDVQKLHMHNLDELIPLIEKKEAYKLYSYYKNNNINLHLNFFLNRYNLLNIIRTIEIRNKPSEMDNFYIIYLAKILKINPKEMRNILGEFFEIGYNEPLQKHLIVKKNEFLNMCKNNFQGVISGNKLINLCPEAILGIVTAKGLVIVCPEYNFSKKYRCYTYPKTRKEANKFIEKIKKLEGDEI